jgi:hypothetical protein
VDTIGLLAAWSGVLGILVSALIGTAIFGALPRLQRWWALTSPARAARRIERLSADLASPSADRRYLTDLITLYGGMILTLVAGAAWVVVSIVILDLGPALLAAILPFSINSKAFTRVTGLLLLGGTFVFLFRFSYLAVRLRLRTLPGKSGYARTAEEEIKLLQQVGSVRVERTFAPVPAQARKRGSQ